MISRSRGGGEHGQDCGYSLDRVVGGAGRFLFARRKEVPQQAEADYADVFSKVDALVRAERLFADPDINLSRIARRLTMPARDVSKAINQATNQNVSQYVNGLRIEEACRVSVGVQHQVQF